MKLKLGFALPEGGLTQPPEYAGQLDLLLVVDPRVPLALQHEKAKISSDYVDYENIRDILVAPSGPYAIWTHDGRRHQKTYITTLPNALKGFKDYEEASLAVEVTALYLQYPDLFDQLGIEAPGSTTVYRVSDSGLDREVATRLDALSGACWFSKATGSSRINYAPLSRGKQIIELGRNHE